MNKNNTELYDKQKEIAMIEMQDFENNNNKRVDDDLPKCKSHF